MSRASNRRCDPALGQAGTASLEFALVALPFMLLMIAGVDLGRYFITQQSLHTLTSEAARLAVVNCFGLDACTYAQAVPTPSTVWAKVPFLDRTQPLASLTVTQSRNVATGVKTITATANYRFTFILPAWTGIANLNPIVETTRLTY
jgi:hypothetical protein